MAAPRSREVSAGTVESLHQAADSRTLPPRRVGKAKVPPLSEASGGGRCPLTSDARDQPRQEERQRPGTGLSHFLVLPQYFRGMAPSSNKRGSVDEGDSFRLASILRCDGLSNAPSLARPYYQDRGLRTSPPDFNPCRIMPIKDVPIEGPNTARATIGNMPAAPTACGTTVSMPATRAARGITANKPTPHAASARHTTQPADAPPAGAAGGCAHKKAADLSSTSPAIGGIGAVPPARASAQSWSGPIMSA